MMTSKSPSKIDSVEIGEVSINFFTSHETGSPSQGVMSAKYALVVSSEGIRMGSGNRNIWSEATLEKLHALVKAMESDICLDVFGEGHTASSGVIETEGTADGVPGL